MNPSFEHAGRCRSRPIWRLYDLHLLRPDRNPRKTGAAPDPESQDQPSESREETIVCRQCLHEITSFAERTVVNGAHRHTFANPEGILFEIACYRNAWGCGYVGPSSPEFTWFAGYLWRIAVCARCHTHLGWHFAGPDGHSFHGLITGQIIARAI